MLCATSTSEPFWTVTRDALDFALLDRSLVTAQSQAGACATGYSRHRSPEPCGGCPGHRRRRRSYPPAAVAARGLTGFRIANALFGALAQVAPERVPACESGGDTGITIGGYDDQRRPFVFLEFLHGSWGGRPDRDGIDACSSVVANFSNNPIEQLEAEYPLRIEQYGFVPDSGGAGKYRGGLAMIRDYRFLEREGALQLRTDRHRFQPWGLAGGKPGAPSSNFLISGEQTRQLASKEYLMLHRGDLLRHTLAGAGGHGDPLERDPARVAADVADGKVSAEGARLEYGVVLDALSGESDPSATEALRAGLARPSRDSRSSTSSTTDR